MALDANTGITAEQRPIIKIFILLGSFQRADRPVKKTDCMETFLATLAAIGVNLKQRARKIHESGRKRRPHLDGTALEAAGNLAPAQNRGSQKTQRDNNKKNSSGFQQIK